MLDITKWLKLCLLDGASVSVTQDEIQDWILLNTTCFSFLTFLFVIMVIVLWILGFDCVNYLCVNLGIYLVSAYNLYMAISSDHVA
jgi:hypothetical protein